ncbi:galactose-binding domain-like protein [Dissophora ornata]|nr:Allantoicase [Dissophora ornata]KAI8597688.1 galactose-binding domain-like protein [Dissophora ornata]
MGQGQSRQQEEEGYFKLEVSQKDSLVNKYTELASVAKGGKVLKTSDEFFGEGSQLIKEEDAIEDKNRETAHGFWKDGWETRRHNKKTHHSATIQLACQATIAGFDIDTSFFDGSHPAYASVEACLIVEGAENKNEWQEILPKVPLSGNSHHFFGINGTDDAFTHVRLNMYPDGGIARFRVFGKVSPIYPDEKKTFDLASLSSGGRIIKTSEYHYGNPYNILLPTASLNTRYGWQTPRSHVEGHHDWVEIKLGATGILEWIEVDTTHFRGNSPEFVSLDACQSEYNNVQFDPEVRWVSLLKKSEVEGDKKNTYSLEATGEAYTHVRLNIFPDGGISRLRVHGVRVPEVIAPLELLVVEEEEEEEELIQSVDDLKVNESDKPDNIKPVVPDVTTLLSAAAKSSTKSKAQKKITVVETEVTETETFKDGNNNNNVVLTSEVSSVTTLVEEEAEPVKKTPAKRGRGKAAGNAAATTTKTVSKKKTKGRSSSVLDEDGETFETTTTTATTAPRAKKARE